MKSNVLLIVCFTGLLIASLGILPAQSVPDNKKMNILFIAFDDLRPEINSFGKSHMKTPNLDRLASEGVSFKRAYCQQSICMASRASIMSGIRPENRKLYSCGDLETLAPELTTMNEHFAQNGYTCEAIGKVYHHKSDHLAQFGEKWHDPSGDWAGRGYITDEALAQMDANGRFDESRKVKGPAFEMPDVEDNYYLDGANAEFAVTRLKKLRKQNRPFFFAIGFHKPHLPWCAPKKYWDMYPAKDISLSPVNSFPENSTPYTLTNWGELRGYFGIPQGEDQISGELAIHLRRAYYASVSYADAQLGRVLDALEKYGMKDNTIIVLWGDHGFKLGDHHAWSKHTNFEMDTRVPVIISVPGMKHKGTFSLSFAELVDLYPTLCELSGTEIPEHLEGKSLVPVLKNPEKEIHEFAGSIFPRNRTDDSKTITGFSLRTKEFRYVEWIHLATGRIMATELYDHKRDTLEHINVAGKMEYAQVIIELSNKLHQTYDKSIPGLKDQPELYLYNPAELLYVRSLAKQGNELYVKAIRKLCLKADDLLDVKPFSVLQKKMIPPSKNMHDYYSLGIYWWPNPATDNGLPYIRQDGKRNPEYKNYDGITCSRMSEAVFTLSLAYFYTSCELYAAKANELIYTWFLNPETKMNPTLEYGQAIPGVVEGRGIGIIETSDFIDIVHAVGFLKKSHSFPEENYKGIKNWIREYTHWLLTSNKGWDERMWHNNHGSSYDSQVATYSMFTKQDSVARMILDSVRIKRIDPQIEPDGSQPWELERTKSMSYSIKNLRHLMENAILAQEYGIDLWNYESEDGGSVSLAIRYLIPYMLGNKKWPYIQYGGLDKNREGFKRLLWIADKYLDDEIIHNALVVLCEGNEIGGNMNLLYPVFNNTPELNEK